MQRSLHSLEALRLAGIVIGLAAALACGFLNPSWSPDGRLVAFAFALSDSDGIGVGRCSLDGEDIEVWVEPAEDSIVWSSQESAESLVLLVAPTESSTITTARVERLRKGDDGKVERQTLATFERSDSVSQLLKYGPLFDGPRLWSRMGEQQPCYVDLRDGTLHVVDVGAEVILSHGPLGLFALGPGGSEVGEGVTVNRLVEGEAGWTLEPLATVSEEVGGLLPLAVGTKHLGLVSKSSNPDEGCRARIYDARGQAQHVVDLPFREHLAIPQFDAEDEHLWVVAARHEKASEISTLAPADRMLFLCRIVVESGELRSWDLGELLEESPKPDRLIGASVSPTDPILALNFVRGRTGDGPDLVLVDFRSGDPRAVEVRAPR